MCLKETNEPICFAGMYEESDICIARNYQGNGYAANRRLNKDGTYSGVEYYLKMKY